MYYLLLPFVYLVSFLPFGLMYLFSDLLNLVLFGVVQYRKAVITNNLEKSFPEKSYTEIKRIRKGFQRYFCDLVLETLKTLTIGKKSVMKRVRLLNPEIFQHYFNEKKSILIVMGHYGNWELAGARFGLQDLHQLIVIYHPLKDKHFDSLVYKMRTRLGNELYARNDVLRGMVKDRSRITATAFIADQTPGPENAYWTTFLNQDTPVFTGTEKIARKFNYPIVYCTVFRTKRGYYDIHAETLFERPGETKDGEISEAHTRRLEKDIRISPEIWLWSHKRWKYQRTTGNR